MKTIYTLIILSFLSLSAFCQSIDENGRTAAQRITSATTTQEVSLKEDTALKTDASFTLKYTLPVGKASGEIVLFHPKVDKVLKKVSLSQQQGSIEFSVKDLPVNIIATLYSDNVPIKSTNVTLVN